MDLVGEYGLGMAVKVVLGLLVLACVTAVLEGEAGLNF